MCFPPVVSPQSVLINKCAVVIYVAFLMELCSSNDLTVPVGLSVQPESSRCAMESPRVDLAGSGESGRTHSLSCQWRWRAEGKLACILPKITLK